MRRAREADLPWLIETARIAYASGTFSDKAAEAWLRSLIANPAVLFLRGEKAAAVAIIKELPYAPGVRAGYLLPVFSRGKAGVELLRMTEMILKWAHDHGATDFYFAAVTGVDFGPLARRFGGKPVSPSYVVRL